jgi:RNA polymerase sigma-70 factor (ECF subfamily)
MARFVPRTRMAPADAGALDRGNDTSALYQQALTHADGLYNLARRLTGGTGDAEDLVQDTYTRAFAGLAGFERGSNLRAWLFRILRNAYIDALRRRGNDPIDRDGEMLDDNGPVASTAANQLRDCVAGDIEAAIAELPVAAREVLLLDIEGLSEAEMATIVGVPVGTIKSRLSRARAALRAALQEYAR